MEGGLISPKTAAALVAAVFALVGFFTWQSAQDKQAEEDQRVCELTAALANDSDEDC